MQHYLPAYNRSRDSKNHATSLSEAPAESSTRLGDQTAVFPQRPDQDERATRTTQTPPSQSVDKHADVGRGDQTSSPGAVDRTQWTSTKCSPQEGRLAGEGTPHPGTIPGQDLPETSWGQELRMGSPSHDGREAQREDAGLGRRRLTSSRKTSPTVLMGDIVKVMGLELQELCHRTSQDCRSEWPDH